MEKIKKGDGTADGECVFSSPAVQYTTKNGSNLDGRREGLSLRRHKVW